MMILFFFSIIIIKWIDNRIGNGKHSCNYHQNFFCTKIKPPIFYPWNKLKPFRHDHFTMLSVPYDNDVDGGGGCVCVYGACMHVTICLCVCVCLLLRNASFSLIITKKIIFTMLLLLKLLI